MFFSEHNMSNKANKRVSKKISVEEIQGNGDADESFKSDTEELKGFSEAEINAKPITNDLEEQTPEESHRLMVTRSQSATPQPKRPEETSEETVETSGNSEEVKENGDHPITNGVEVKQDEVAEIIHIKETISEVLVTEQIELEPLADEPDEPEPELQFDENSDLESGKNSPAVSRCMTRRSQIRNVPTPKTPRLIPPEQRESENSDVKEPEQEEVLENNQNGDQGVDSFESVNSEDLSTFVAVGSDATRINFFEERTFDGEVDSPFLKSLKERSYNNTLPKLSTRRSIRSVSRVSLFLN